MRTDLGFRVSGFGCLLESGAPRDVGDVFTRVAKEQ